MPTDKNMDPPHPHFFSCISVLFDSTKTAGARASRTLPSPLPLPLPLSGITAVISAAAAVNGSRRQPDATAHPRTTFHQSHGGHWATTSPPASRRAPRRLAPVRPVAPTAAARAIAARRRRSAAAPAISASGTVSTSRIQ